MSTSWLTITECARQAGVPARTMRHRLRNLAMTHPKLLVSAAPPGRACGKWLVNAAELARILGSDDTGAGASEERYVELEARIADLESKLLALRNAHVKLLRRVRRLTADDQAQRDEPPSQVPARAA